MAMVVTGLEAVNASFMTAAATAHGDALSATRKAAAAIKAAQQAEVPVDRGTTRRSVKYNTSVSASSVRASIGATHFVARFLQYGTVNMSAKMDLFAASQPGIDQWLSDMDDVGRVR